MHRDPTDFRGQEAEKAEADSKKRIQRDKELDDIKQLMGSRAGRRLAWRFISLAGVYRDSGNLDLGPMAYEKGLRVLGQMLIVDIHAACPEQYEVMKREQRNGR